MAAVEAGLRPFSAFVFHLRGRAYGLLHDPTAIVAPWIQRYTPPGPIPGAPDWLLGLLSVQGVVQPIVDLGAFAGLGLSTPTTDTRYIFLQREELCVGLLVDAASSMRDFEDLASAHTLSPEPAALLGRLVAGAGQLDAEGVPILHVGALLDALVKALDTPTVVDLATS